MGYIHGLLIVLLVSMYVMYIITRGLAEIHKHGSVLVSSTDSLKSMAATAIHVVYTKSPLIVLRVEIVLFGLLWAIPLYSTGNISGGIAITILGSSMTLVLLMYLAFVSGVYVEEDCWRKNPEYQKWYTGVRSSYVELVDWG